MNLFKMITKIIKNIKDFLEQFFCCSLVQGHTNFVLDLFPLRKFIGQLDKKLNWSIDFLQGFAHSQQKCCCLRLILEGCFPVAIIFLIEIPEIKAFAIKSVFFDPKGLFWGIYGSRLYLLTILEKCWDLNFEVDLLNWNQYSHSFQQKDHSLCCFTCSLCFHLSTDRMTNSHSLWKYLFRLLVSLIYCWNLNCFSFQKELWFSVLILFFDDSFLLMKNLTKSYCFRFCFTSSSIWSTFEVLKFYRIDWPYTLKGDSIYLSILWKVQDFSVG